MFGLFILALAAISTVGFIAIVGTRGRDLRGSDVVGLMASATVLVVLLIATFGPDAPNGQPQPLAPVRWQEPITAVPEPPIQKR